MCDTKICSKCGKELSLDDFYKKSSNKDRYRSTCKTCYNLHLKELRESRPRPIITEKYCKHCNTIKCVIEFHKNKNTTDGYSVTCKTCSSRIKQNRILNFTKSTDNIIEKQCRTCNTIKSILEFGIDKYSKDGYNTRCKKCVNADKKRRTIFYNDNVHYDIDATKRCCQCKIIKNVSEFYTSKRCKDGLAAICKVCANINAKLTIQNNPEINRRSNSKRRNFGHNPINKTFNWSDSHHLHLENNHDFIINIPCWLHRLYSHNSYNWKNMDSMNAIALDFWVNEELYKDLYEL